MKSVKIKKKQDNFLLLRLYVAGETPNSQKAITNLNTIGKELPNGHKIEIVNTLDDPIRALEEGILVTPTLVIKRGPLPMRQIIGDLSDEPKVLQALGGLKKNGIRAKKAS
ncbi:MAG TPA: circadian clock KaiB family protein [bacterium]|nr:circadian clock KaiB family protein [bacterium]